MKLNRLTTGVLLLVLIFAVGVFGYWMAGWSPIDAVYMVVITIFSVGYGEVQPVEGTGMRIFTIAIIVAGCSDIIYLMSGLVGVITEGELERLMGRRRMTREISHMEGHVILCGYGRLGRVLAAELHRRSVPFVVVDNDEGRTREADLSGFVVFQGDATSDEVLREVGVERARALATVLPNDALNVFITLTARTLNGSLLIVARGEVPTTESKLTQAGADKVVLPSSIGGIQAADLLLRPAVTDVTEAARSDDLRRDLIQIGVDFDAWTIPKGNPVVGRTIRELEQAGHGRFLVAAIRRRGVSIPAPEGAEDLRVGDEVVVLKRHGEDVDLMRIIATRFQRIRYRGAGG